MARADRLKARGVMAEMALSRLKSISPKKGYQGNTCHDQDLVIEGIFTDNTTDDVFEVLSGLTGTG
jgi:hypothetical protein